MAFENKRFLTQVNEVGYAMKRSDAKAVFSAAIDWFSTKKEKKM